MHCLCFVGLFCRWAIWSPYALVGDLVILHYGGGFGHLMLWRAIWSSYVLLGDLVTLCAGGQFLVEQFCIG